MTRIGSVYVLTEYAVMPQVRSKVSRETKVIAQD